MPFIALRIELREIVPLRLRFERFEAGVACEGAGTVRKKSPAIGGKTMFRSTGGRDDATKPVRLKNPGDFAHCFPKKLDVLEGLAGNDDVDTGRVEFGPMIRVAQDKIDILPRREVDALVSPGRFGKERAIGAVNVEAAKIDNDKRLVAPGL